MKALLSNPGLVIKTGEARVPNVVARFGEAADFERTSFIVDR
jgi:hypothetical protein